MTTETAASPTATATGTDQPNANGVTPEGEGATLLATTPPATEVKAAEGENTQVAEEITYEFTKPEGIELDKASTDEFVAIAKELKLPKDAAQKMMDLAVKREQVRVDTHRATVDGWATAAKADKELGGDKLAETLATASKAIDLGPPELKELLNVSGLGNHPAVIRWAYTVGKALSEDNFVQGVKAPQAQGTPASRLYQNTPSV